MMKDTEREEMNKKFGRMLSIGSYGIGCGEGWDHILYNLLECIESHISNIRNNIAVSVRYNRAVHKLLDRQDVSYLRSYYIRQNISEGKIDGFVNDALERITERGEAALRCVGDAPEKVNIIQIKEKFGGLRFYYNGGDEEVSGMVTLAEHMSYATCERCGANGELRKRSWLETLCDSCHGDDKND